MLARHRCTLRIIGCVDAFVVTGQSNLRASSAAPAGVFGNTREGSARLARLERAARLRAGVQSIIAAQVTGASAGLRRRLRSQPATGQRLIKGTLAEREHQDASSSGRCAQMTWLLGICV